MARVKNIDLSTLTPAQAKFWRGLKHAPGLAAGDMVFKVPSKSLKQRRPRPFSHRTPDSPDEKISQLALNAAQWLADHHTREVSEIGRDSFVVARVNEILSGSFPPKYWDVCPEYSTQNYKSIPVCTPRSPQPLPKFQTPGSANSNCVYSTCQPDNGQPGFSGSTHLDGYFHDDFLIEKQTVFTVPAPLWTCGVRPMFSKHETQWLVNHRHKNHQMWCSLYHAAHAATAAALPDRTQSVDAIGRYFYWQYEIPIPAPAGSVETMSRSFVVDANYLSNPGDYNPDVVGYCLIKESSATARGRFHFGNTELQSTTSHNTSLFVAKPDDHHDPACSPYPPTIKSWAYVTNPTDPDNDAQGCGNPCEVWWYVPLPSVSGPGVPPWPKTDPRLYHAVLPVRGSTNNVAKGKHLRLPIIQWGRGNMTSTPKNNDPTIYKVCLARAGVVGCYGSPPGSVKTCDGPEAPNICQGSYAGWGYQVYNQCTKKTNNYLFPGARPSNSAFAAAWALGKYPA